MDLIFKIIAISLVTCVAILIIRPIRNDFAVLLSVVGGIIIILFVMQYVSEIFSTLHFIVNETGLSSSLFSLILKIVGIGYLTEFTVGVCVDSGVGGLGDKVLLGGKIVILAMALPVINSILEIIIGLLPT